MTNTSNGRKIALQFSKIKYYPSTSLYKFEIQLKIVKLRPNVKYT